MSKSGPLISKKYLKKYESIIPFINKQVDFKFFGEKLKFFLSQELFSSFKIDSGSELLLKTIARQIEIPGCIKILDIGCGTGIIGLSLKKKFPEMELYMTDRDALAVEFTRLNAEFNNIYNCNVSGELGSGAGKQEYDLITANLPAKAGSGVLNHLILSILCSLNENGTAAIVIVKTLKAFAEDWLKKANSEILFSEHSREYSVYHFRKKENREKNISMDNYIRTETNFKFNKNLYRLKTVYNLPDFDTIGYQARLVMEFISLFRVKGSALFYNPGQGHLPVYCSKINEIKDFSLAGRDILALKISEYNLKNENINNVFISHIPSYKEIKTDKKFDIIVFMQNNMWINDHYACLFHSLKSLMNKQCILFICAKSTWMHRLLNYKHDLRVLNDKKENGFRVIVLKNSWI